MSKARNIADIGSHDVIETDSDGVTITGGLSSNDLTVAGNAIATAGSLSNRNKIINGAMVIDQRNAGASVTVNTAFQFYTVDRFYGSGQTSDGVFTVQQDTDSPAGFNNSLKVTVTTADASIGATQLYRVEQRIEGFNVADLGWGSANAQTVTLSFWVKSSLTGTMGGAVFNFDGSRSYPFTYSISSANTWEHKTITIAGDTSGTWLTSNGIGLFISLSLGTGADRRGTAGSWAASFLAGATGQTQVIENLNATFYITGVQLEVGDTATPFEQRSYGQELALCQRYYEENFFHWRQFNGPTFTLLYVPAYLAVPKRAQPTATILSGGTTVNCSGAIDSRTTQYVAVAITPTSGSFQYENIPFSADAEL